MTLPIYVMYDTGITHDEEISIVEALADLKKIFPERKIVNFGKAAWGNGEYSSANWYVQKTMDIDKIKDEYSQLNADVLVDLMSNEPYQEATPHIDVMFTSRDLTSKIWDLNFCFGMTRGRCTVQSVYRYRWLNAADKHLAIKAVVLHELGHVFGMARNPKREKTVQNLGMHCTQPGCIMQQGITIDAFVRHAKEAQALHRYYCPLCLQDARRSPI